MSKKRKRVQASPLGAAKSASMARLSAGVASHSARKDSTKRRCRTLWVASVNVVENVDGLEVATAQAALGGSWRASLASGGLSISPMASTPM